MPLQGWRNVLSRLNLGSSSSSIGSVLDLRSLWRNGGVGSVSMSCQTLDFSGTFTWVVHDGCFLIHDGARLVVLSNRFR